MLPRLPKGLLLLAVLAAGLLALAPASGGVFQGSNGPIAYTCGANICTINPDGSGKNASFVAGASDPSWSSDESEIAYLSGGTITVANNDGTFPGSVGAAAGSTQPTLSFDGNRVAYVRAGALYTSQTLGGGEVAVAAANAAGADADPAYSPDGTKIAYASNDGATGFDIWTVNLSNGALHQVTNALGDERSPTWSPSGVSLVYSAGPTHELFGAAAATAGIPTPADLGVGGTDPAFSPDGTRIAFVNGAGNLAVMTNTASPTVSVLDSSGSISQPDWEAVTPPSGPPSSFTGPPVNTAYPTINLASGDARPTVGNFLTASVGSWNGAFPLTYTYQWKRCDAADPHNGQCFDIPNARSSFYTPVAADFGMRLRVQVTATNSQGTASQNSEVSDVVTAIAPRLRVTPPIIGQNVVDQVLSIGFATWDGAPAPTFTYSWRRCNAAGDLASCVEIPGATSATYTATVADIGFSIRLWITGTNIAGSDFGITNHTFPIVDKEHFAPSSSVAPLIAGTVGLGRQLTSSTGTFIGDAPIKTAFVWQRCDATGAACHTIAGAKRNVYLPTPADLGSTLRLAVTATNGYGSMVALSDPTDPVPASPPHRKGLRIVGTSRDEYLAGGGWDDVIYGMGGNDTLLGGRGDDRIGGGDGNDLLTGGPGVDVLSGGAGSDTIYAADGERDIVNCGDGRDRAVVDSVDVVKNCELVQTATETTPAPTAPPVAPGAPSPRR